MARQLLVTAKATPATSVGRHVDYVPQAAAKTVIRTYNAAFYDSAAYGVPSTTVAAITHNLFSTGLGAGATSPIFQSGNKTYTDTNLQTSGAIFPAGQAFKAESMGCFIAPCSVTGNNAATTAWAQYINDVLWLVTTSYMTVGGGTTVIPLGPISHWPAGYGVSASAGGSSTANGVTQYGVAANNGQPQHISRQRFSDQPISFNSQQAFLVNVVLPVAAQQMTVIRSFVQVAWWGTWSDVLGG